MSKKLFFLAVILMLVLSLAACSNTDNTVKSIAVNDPYGLNGEKLVFDYEDRDNILFKGENGLSYWSLTASGTGSLVSYEGSLPTTVVENEGVRTYTFEAEELTVSFQVYIIPEIIVGDPDEVVMVA